MAEKDASAAQKESEYQEVEAPPKDYPKREEANPSRGTSHTLHTQQSIFSPGQTSQQSQLSQQPPGSANFQQRKGPLKIRIMNPNAKLNPSKHVFNMGKEGANALGTTQSIHSAQNVNERAMPPFGALPKAKRVSGLMKLDQQSTAACPANVTSSSFTAYMGPLRRPGSKGLQHSERTYQPQGIGAQISGQNFYKAVGTDIDSCGAVEKQDGPFKKLKINAEYLQKPSKFSKKNDVEQEKEKVNKEYKIQM